METVIALCLLGYIVYIVLILWKIVRKTGDYGWASVLILIPVINVIYLSYMAFSEWPIETELNKYRKRYGALESSENTRCVDDGTSGVLEKLRSGYKGLLGKSEPVTKKSPDEAIL